MTRVIVALSIVLVPVSALAQAQTDDPFRLMSAAGVTLQTSGQPQRRPAPPPPPPDTERPRRRGSMVGYIQDAVVGSKFRIRFDTALHNEAPDRAEFFYAKCGCYAQLAVLAPPFYDPDAPGPGPGQVTRLNFQQLYAQGEYALNEAVSVFGELPLRWIQPKEFASVPPGSFDTKSGLSDLRAGVKFAAVSDESRVLTLQFQAFMPTGKSENGMGTNHFSFEPSFLFYQSVNDRVAVESQVGVWLPAGGSSGAIASDDTFSGNVFFYGIGPSFEIYRSNRLRFAPVVELVGWRVLGGLETFGAPLHDASGTNIVNLKLGARTVWDNKSSFYIGWGHALTTASWYDDIVRFEYRYAF